MSFSSSVSPSPTPLPAKSRWARVGGAVRRASSVLVPVRPATPAPDNDAAFITSSTKASQISGIDTTSDGRPAPKLPPEVTTPSPIAESPAREVAATQEADAVAPSPLGQRQTAEAYTEPTQISSPNYLPPPLIDLAEELPQSMTIEDPWRPRSAATAEQPAVQEEPKQDPEPEFAPAPAAPEASALTREPEELPQTMTIEEPKRDDESARSAEPTPVAPKAQPAEVAQATPKPQFTEPAKAVYNTQADGGVNAPPTGAVTRATAHPAGGEAPSDAEVQRQPGRPPSLVDSDTGANFWGTYIHEPVNTSNTAYDNPFRDFHETRLCVAQADCPPMTTPYTTQQPYEVNHSPEPSPVLTSMPIPTHTHEAQSSYPPQLQTTDERQPLWGGNVVTNKPSFFGNPTSSDFEVSRPSPSGYGGVGWANLTLDTTHLHSHGWVEYVLLDGTAYYFHPARRVVTNVNLREDKWFDIVKDHVDHFGDGTSAAAGVELWLRAPDLRKRGFFPSRLWVDHKAQSVKPDNSSENGHGNSKRKDDQDDQLDLHYRYWSFIASHPSHQKLPAHAMAEAVDLLSWSWTDRLLPTHRAIPAPFSREECQELLSLLHSFGTEQGEKYLQRATYTRAISRVFLRVFYWRQQQFRPYKTLPKDAGAPPSVKYRRPFFRALSNILKNRSGPQPASGAFMRFGSLNRL